MIHTDLSVLGPLKRLGRNMKRALEFLENTDLNQLTCGRHTICGDEIFALVSEYCTCDPSLREYESHKKYVDLHCVIAGEEQIRCCPVHRVSVAGAYSEERDKLSYNGSDWTASVRLQEGTAVILFPSDIHKAGLNVDGVKPVKKLVLKVAAE